MSGILNLRTITRKNEEFIVFCWLVHRYLRIRGHNLLLRVQRVVLFELEVPYGSGKSEIPFI